MSSNRPSKKVEDKEETKNRPKITDYINYHPRVGPLQLIEFGYPGSGKSSHATATIILCLERKNECVLMHGDVACEWRHFLRYSKYVKKILVLVHKEAQIERKNFPSQKEIASKYKVELEIRKLDFHTMNIVDCLEDKQITVVYDDCFAPASKTQLWVNIAKQLIFRMKKNNLTITYLCHETSNYYPQTARGEQWNSVDRFCDYFVFFRKRGIRAFLLSQLENEVYDRLRKKCIYRVYRRCYPSNRTHAKKIKKYILKMRIDHYHLFFGDLFNPMRRNKATKEIRSKWLMIPRDLLNLNGRDISTTTYETDSKLTEIIVNTYHYTESIREAAKILGVARDTVRGHLVKAGVTYS